LHLPIRTDNRIVFCSLSKISQPDQKTGVWVKPGAEENLQKIVSIGIKVDVRGVSRHGFALNVQPEMDYWQGIVPCGLAETTMTSMKDILHDPIEMNLVYDQIIKDFGQVFDMTMVEG